MSSIEFINNLPSIDSSATGVCVFICSQIFLYLNVLDVAVILLRHLNLPKIRLNRIGICFGIRFVLIFYYISLALQHLWRR